MPVERIIGIDFGTSTSVVKIKTYKDNDPVDLKDMADYVRFDNKDSLPTLIYKTDDGDCLVGYEAANAAVRGKLHQNFKLALVSNDAEERSQAVELTKTFFKYLYKTYNEQSTYFPSCDKETTYISYPAKWPHSLASMMVEIAKQAGFKNVVGIDEPTAAMYAVMILEIEKLQSSGLVKYGDTANILMIDLGAGTTDLVLCKYKFDNSHRIEIINTWPEASNNLMFGGREIDLILCEYIKKYLVERGLPNTKNFNEKYLDKCKSWKETNLSPTFKNSDGVVKYCGFIDTLLGMLDMDNDFPPMRRDDFEGLISGCMRQFPLLINGCMENAREKYKFNPSDLDFVILTGGHSQWYFASDIVLGSLSKYGNVSLPKIQKQPQRIIKLARPQETVALGLVYQRLALTVKKTDGPVPGPTPGPTPRPNPGPERPGKSSRGNSPANSNCEGQAAYYDGWVYYGNCNIYKIREDGSMKQSIMKEMNALRNLNIVDGWIYYSTVIKNMIVKVRIDGSDKTVLHTHNRLISFLSVVDGWIYFRGDNTELFRMRTDGSEKIKVNIGKSDDLNIVDDWIYYADHSTPSSPGELCKIHTSGSEKKVLDNMACSHINVVDGWIYYSVCINDFNIFKMKTDGSSKIKLNNEPSFFLNVADGWIYYTTRNNGIHKMRLNGTERTKLNDGHHTKLNVAGGWIFYRHTEKQHIFKDDETKPYRMRIDGSQNQPAERL